MASHPTSIAEFTREFFKFLDAKGERAVVLHGGEKGFEGEISDVDFAVGHETFAKLPLLIDAYCTERGWWLCQVLRHETTAAFYVCSSREEPARVVALDVCSDYQRNGIHFLSAEDLLSEREMLPWGGYRMTAANELKYRFTKAAAKGKDPKACTDEFTDFPRAAREECAVWLKKTWQVDPGEWNSVDLANSIDALGKRCKSHPSLLQSGSAIRIMRRVLKPTGLVVITGQSDFDAIAERMGNVFGKLYFRKVQKAARFQPVMLKHLISSTLIFVSRMPRHWMTLLPTDCIHCVDLKQDSDAQCIAIASHLHQRCIRRAYQ